MITWDRGRLLWLIGCLLLAGALTGCTGLPLRPLTTPTPVATREATATSPPPTPLPTWTPTITPTPQPSPTPMPTIAIPILTPSPSPVPLPTPAFPIAHLPERVVPETFGVEIHFTRASQQELDYIARGGFGWVRMDLFWHTIEKAYGQYDFSEYDILVRSMEARDIRIIFILDYGNSLYDQGYPPTSPGGRAAFANFAAAAARRYRGKGIIWEIWNEPNLDHFWTPEANPANYSRLALGAIAAIRSVDPTALIVAPALAGYEWPFWHTVGSMGVFERVDAITVHSYGVYQPEQILQPYLSLRKLINRYSPEWKVPILSGEWGFSTTQGGMSEGQQAQYLSRQWLFNLAHDINVNIWYDWHDDGPDPHNPEHHFGVVRHDYTAKPSYQAARTINTTLAGYRFLRRIPMEHPQDYLLLFERPARDVPTGMIATEVAMALWTTRHDHTLLLPISVEEATVVYMTGNTEKLPSEGHGLSVGISQSPRYLLFRSHQAPASLGGWRPVDTINCLPAEESVPLPLILEGDYPLERPGKLEVRAQGQVLGSRGVVLQPATRQRVYVPVDLSELSGNVQAEVHFLSEDPAMAPLHSALIWLQITP